MFSFGPTYKEANKNKLLSSNNNSPPQESK